jgi:hypothetical protein
MYDFQAGCVISLLTGVTNKAFQTVVSQNESVILEEERLCLERLGCHGRFM